MEKETARVEAFSDGVFAIAITLLILEIRIPPAGSPLAPALLRLWPSYVAFLISFLTIGVMWINHHRLFTIIRHSNDALLGLNLLLLLGITFVPFPTAVLAQHIVQSGARTAAIFYSASFVVIAIFFNVLWHAVVAQGLLGPAADEQMVHGITRQYSFGPLYYLVATVVAIFSPLGSVAINLALAIFFAIPARRFHVAHPRRTHSM